MIISRYSETQAKGEIACLKFDLRALEKGGISSKPIIDCAYDRILDIDNNIYRVQIKYANRTFRNSTGAVYLDLRRTTFTKKILLYQESEIDILVAYIPAVDKLCWFNDKNLFINKQTIVIRYLPPKSNRKKGCRMIDDYIW